MQAEITRFILKFLCQPPIKMTNEFSELRPILDLLNPEAPLAQRHLWLIGLLNWLRGDSQQVKAVQIRINVLLDEVQARPKWRTRWRRWWHVFMQEVDTTPLLADHGFAQRNAFMNELGHRLYRKFLPLTPETSDLAELFDLLFPSTFDGECLRALEPETLLRIHALLFTDAPLETSLGDENAPMSRLPSHHYPGANNGQAALMDALTYSVSQISATGFASEIRSRMSDTAQNERPFHDLPAHFEHFHDLVEFTGARSEESLKAATLLRAQLDACRHAAYSVYAHLEEHGISVGIVFRVRQLRERVLRIKSLLDCFQSAHPVQEMSKLLAQLVDVSKESRSLRSLIANSAHLTAAKVAERNAETGDHYIARNLTEYQQILRQAAGGGALIALTTGIKFSIHALGLSVFWGGLAAGLNYAMSFVLIMLLHWTVATKQPAMTAPLLAAKLKEINNGAPIENFVTEVQHLLRSQIAAIIGNIGVVVPLIVLVSWIFQYFGLSMLNADYAEYTLQSTSLLGPTVLFAAFTGVLLFASSIVAGWVENWFVLHRIDSAIRYNPKITARLGAARAFRWSIWWRRHISGLAGNISLGLMLGLIPAFLMFYGLDIEVRHVTLAAGQLAAAVFVLGVDILDEASFWWAVAGVVAIGPINLGVSFYFAFRLALRANSMSRIDQKKIQKALLVACYKAPLRFFLPFYAKKHAPNNAESTD